MLDTQSLARQFWDLGQAIGSVVAKAHPHPGWQARCGLSNRKAAFCAQMSGGRTRVSVCRRSAKRSQAAVQAPRSRHGALSDALLNCIGLLVLDEAEGPFGLVSATRRT